MKVPFVEYAHAAISDQSVSNTLGPIVTHIVEPIIQLMFAVAVVVFVYGVFQMVWNKADAEGHTKGRNSMTGGLIGMFIMLSAWGIINLISNTVKSI